MRDCWLVSMADGMMTNSDYPYRGKHGRCKHKQSKVVSSASVTGRCNTPEDAAIWLQDGPLAFAVVANDCFRWYSWGVISSEDNCTARKEDLNHAAVIVGLEQVERVE